MNLPLQLKLVLLACLPLGVAAGGQEPGAGGETQAPTAESVVRGLYDLVTFGPDARPDWDKVRSRFMEQAVVVLRTSRTEQTVFDVDGFVEDFQRFAALPAVQENGFQERVLKTKSTVLGDVAHVLVLYEASIPGSPRPPQQGVDSFHLIRREKAWRIVSVLNEIPTAGRPVPVELRSEDEPADAGGP